MVYYYFPVSCLYCCENFLYTGLSDTNNILVRETRSVRLSVSFRYRAHFASDDGAVGGRQLRGSVAVIVVVAAAEPVVVEGVVVAVEEAGERRQETTTLK